MDIFVEDELDEITIDDIISKTSDRGMVLVKGENVGKRGLEHSEIQKEITAIDSLVIGQRAAGEINGVTQPSAGAWKDGKYMEDETKTRILTTRHNIADKAIGKLMQSLDLFDPTLIDKPADIIRSAGILANIVEKTTVQNKNGGNEVHLHLYGPKQNKIDKYEVIDV